MSYITKEGRKLSEKQSKIMKRCKYTEEDVREMLYSECSKIIGNYCVYVKAQHEDDSDLYECRCEFIDFIPNM